jgi:predicted O-methyltransferase YrrM
MRALLHYVRCRLGLDSASRWMMPEETACLIEFARGRTRLAEVGVWEGGTTRLLREAMSPGATLFAVDPYVPGRLGVNYQRLIARNEVGRSTNGSIHWLQTTGVDAARMPAVLAAPFDFVLIDGDHTYEGLRADWEGWSPLVAMDGVVALHDSVDTPGTGGGSFQYSSDVIVRDPGFETVAEVVTLRVLRRIAPQSAAARSTQP